MSNYEFNFGQFKTIVNFFDRDGLIPSYGSLFVADENTEYLIPEEYKDKTIILPSGEVNKTWISLEKILSKAVDLKLGRDATFVGVGGGVICDMTAFAASVYMRGCEVSLVPTTLLSMVDAALGGKSGIDFKTYKNLVGAFYPAKELRIGVDTLKTLDRREFLSGLAEVFKTAMLGNKKILDYLESHKDDILNLKPKALEYIINGCIKVKGSIVEEDLYERSIRATLNLGHTFGHALETVTGFSDFSHGEGVSWGIARALEASKELNIINEEYYIRILKLLKDYGYRLNSDADINKMIEAMTLDKKKKGGVVKFILQKDAEDTVMLELEKDLLKDVLSKKL